MMVVGATYGNVKDRYVNRIPWSIMTEGGKNGVGGGDERMKQKIQALKDLNQPD